MEKIKFFKGSQTYEGLSKIELQFIQWQKNFEKEGIEIVIKEKQMSVGGEVFLLVTYEEKEKKDGWVEIK